MKELFRQPNRSNILLCRYYLYNDKSLFKKKKSLFPIGPTYSFWTIINTSLCFPAWEVARAPAQLVISSEPLLACGFPQPVPLTCGSEGRH